MKLLAGTSCFGFMVCIGSFYPDHVKVVCILSFYASKFPAL
jgi:hypothetical protein